MNEDPFNVVFGTRRGAGRVREPRLAAAPAPLRRCRRLITQLTCAIADPELALKAMQADGEWQQVDALVERLAKAQNIHVHRIAAGGGRGFALAVFSVHAPARIGQIHLQLVAGGGGTVELFLLDGRGADGVLDSP